MVILYRGFLMEEHPKDVIDWAEGTDWVQLVKANGYMLDRHYRICEDGNVKYIDFGDWSVFVKVIEQLNIPLDHKIKIWYNIYVR